MSDGHAGKLENHNLLTVWNRNTIIFPRVPEARENEVVDNLLGVYTHEPIATYDMLSSLYM